MEKTSVEKKRMKYERIESSALELFKKKGIASTTIDDIVKRADVAKGTFYLYFKDKKELVDEIVFKKTGSILQEAMDLLEGRMGKEKMSQSEKVVYVIEYVLNNLEENVEFLEIIHKNIYQGLFHEKNRGLIYRATELFLEEEKEKDERKALHTLYLVMELLGSVMYNTLIMKEPFRLEEMKEPLFRAIKNIVDYA